MASTPVPPVERITAQHPHCLDPAFDRKQSRICASRHPHFAKAPSSSRKRFSRQKHPHVYHLGKEKEKEKWIPAAGLIRPFEYNEWEGWDGESGMYATEESLDGDSGALNAVWILHGSARWDQKRGSITAPSN